ncbi:A1pp-domain-containing protein [Guyanagaster necrorhizus]|uniref:A1pp-domain-containing protein n=1 Tax=Guyanagaster necrorhizus TaxID=856835 RepID=A0A9P7VYE2_9AGAR|nr:A1pp-domain-containing protein [Guyanagaster necrorhizus MCA 3950]KAG7448106.1 A1pp-domain-containing protein [Guyanagaster necrorhizus MCA 3950]
MPRSPSPSDGSDTDTEDMPIALEKIPTLAQLFKLAVIKAVEKPKFPIDSMLLDRISLFQGDITQLSVDSIVNAANKSLLGGGGVDGAIHAAAGKDLLDECRGLNGCETGESKVTKGYRLPSKHIIHTVGPIYSSRDIETKAAQLASCYRTSLELAAKSSLKHIAFPSISTGIYGYPIKDATHIALNEVRQFVATEPGSTLERVIFVVWSNKDRDVYQDLLPEYFPPSVPSENKDEE